MTRWREVELHVTASLHKKNLVERMIKNTGPQAESLLVTRSSLKEKKTIIGNC